MRQNNKLKIELAHSFDSGILFWSTCKKGYGVIVTIDETGSIKTKHGKTDELMEHALYKENFIYNIITDLLTIITIMSVLVICSFFIQGKYQECGQIILGVPSFSLIFMLITNNLEIQSSRFHAAEHMAINAFEDLNRIPSLEEVRSYSRFSNDCGTNLLTYHALIFSSMFACSFIENSTLFVISLLTSLSVIKILKNFNLLNWGQFFTTLPPTDKELKVAIEGLKCWYDYEYKQYELNQASEKNT